MKYKGDAVCDVGPTKGDKWKKLAIYYLPLGRLSAPLIRTLFIYILYIIKASY